MGEDKAELKGKVLGAAGLVEYQDGAVVSREVVRGEKGSLTLFAFDQGQGLSEHTAPFDATVLVLDGEAEILIAGDPLRVEASEMVIMPAGIPHALNAVERFKMMLIMIRA
jgi:quercetin dioxygenase-like cupin family protein